MALLSRSRTHRQERGFSIAFVAAAMVMILAVAAVAIDLVVLYVSRSEAQRSADAAAIAGAMEFVRVGGVAPGANVGTACASADAAARAVAAQNKIGSAAPTVSSFQCPINGDRDNPLVRVRVERSIPTIFARFFGRNAATVSAIATAEAYNGGASGPNICLACLRPFAVSNCRGLTDESGGVVSGCGAGGTYFDPITREPNSGLRGDTVLLHDSSMSSHYNYVGFSSSELSASDLRDAVSQCQTTQKTCGDLVHNATGSMSSVIGELCDQIHASSSGNRCGIGSGQDTIDDTSLEMRAGTGNPLVPSVISAGSVISTSDSVMTVPIVNMTGLRPGHPSTRFPIMGFMQIFVQGTNGNGSNLRISAVILNVTGCADNPNACNSPGGSGTVGGATGGVPVRLVR